METITLDLIYSEILNLKKEIKEIKEDYLEFKPDFIAEMNEIGKEKGIKFKSIEELDKLVENV